jgi:hypothetical protein
LSRRRRGCSRRDFSVGTGRQKERSRDGERQEKECVFHTTDSSPAASTDVPRLREDFSEEKNARISVELTRHERRAYDFRYSQTVPDAASKAWA